ITAKGETTASNTPITWTLPGGSTSTEIQMPVGVGFADAKVTWKSSSEIGKTTAGQIPAPFVSQYNGNFPTLSSVRLTRNIGFTTLQKYADFVDGLAANLYRADVAKARTIYDAIVASGVSGLVSEVAPLGALIEDAEQNLPEDGGDPEAPHVHTYIPETTDATCTEAGSTTYVCEECGHSYVVDGEPLGHDYVGNEIKPATCYEEGEMEYVCSRCDDSYTEITDILEHEYTDGYCDLCGDREVYTPNGAQWTMDFVDADGNEIDTISTADSEFWMVVRLTDYAELIGEMNNTGDLATSTYDRTIASAISVIAMDNSEVIAVRENNKIVYETPYETAILSSNYDSADGLLKSIFYSDDNAGCTFSIGNTDLDAKNGELFRIKVRSKLTEEGTFNIKFAAETNLVSSSVALVNKAEPGEWVSGVNYTKDLEIDDRCYDTVYKMNVTSDGQPPHTHEYTAVTTEPTCTEAGKTVYTCECGHSYEETIAATGHKEITVTLTTEPTCTEAGKTVYTCKCGYSYEETIAAKGHTEETITTDATCDEDGSVTVKCSVCGQTISTETIPATGHSYTSTRTKAPTCKEEGVMTYTCTCGDSYTEAIPTLDHRYTDGYCDICGDREVYTPNGAQWDIDFVDADGNAIDTVSTANGEFWMVVRLTDYADLIGEMNYTGDLATSTYDRTVAVAVAFLQMNDKQVMAVYENDKVVYTTPYETASLLTNYDSADGMLKAIFRSDDSAGCIFSVSASDLDANNGELFRIKVKSQLTEEGKVGVQLVENTAHAVSSVALVNKPEPGEWLDEVSYAEELVIDARCYDTMYEMNVVEGDVHVHDKETVTRDATCKEDGYITVTCNTCGETLSHEIIPAKGHTEKTTTVDATCTADGSITVTCTVCGETISTEIIPATGHNYVDGTCTNCGEADPDAPQGPTYVESMTIPGFNVKFESDYSVYVYVPKTITNQYETVKVIASKAMYEGDTFTGYSDVELTEGISQGDYMLYEYAGFAAKEIASEIKAHIVAIDADGNEFYGPEKNYSLQSYALNKIKNESTPAKFRTMMVDFVNYGA
ncbi:MAG: hypothetical protein IIV63_07095, partial [Clostridia bacterium]|nr:hypothetical protein [Clostridia bacterium]